MANVDLHVHSKFSNHPSEWFLQRLGASESYTEPELIYRTARKRGMDFVTVTDHNRIAASLQLAEKYPERCFTGMEATSYFPEDGCKVHVLIYGLNRKQFEIIQELRRNIYRLRDYLRDQDLACSVAHATYSVNGRLQLHHLEKLILLFNTFEGRNGSRSVLHNDILSTVLRELTPADIERLQARHNIEPWGESPWRKGLTGGSDDHAGFFIGKTSTQSDAASPAEFLRQLKEQRMAPQGRQNDFQGLTFSIYKIAFDFCKQRKTAFSESMISQLTSYLFSDKPLRFRDRLRLKKMKYDPAYQSIYRLIETSRQLDADDVDSRLNLLYDCIAEVSDQYFRSLLKSMDIKVEEVDILQIIQGLSSSIPGIFLSVPFFSAFKHLFASRQLINELQLSLGKEICTGQKRILWLTDTLTDLNGVSMTLQTIGRLAEEKNYSIHIMSSLQEEQLSPALPQQTRNIQPIYSFNLPHYHELKINVPSLLRMLRQIYDENPDEMYISTPGPVGLLGMFIGRLLGIPVKGIYHTDFTSEAEAIIAEPAVCDMIEQYCKWFFNQFDTLFVPSNEYIGLLKGRGYRYRHMELFRRGLRTEHFRPMSSSPSHQDHSAHAQQPSHGDAPRERYRPPFRLLYVGRVSKDKNLDFLMEIYRRLTPHYPQLSLSIVGTGPYLETLREKCQDLELVQFLGRVDYENLPKTYNDHDIFVFPSVTETFGMVVLEAQSSGLPALVSTIGGPQEIIADGQTGYALPVDRIDPWVSRLIALLEDIAAGGNLYANLSRNARKRVVDNYSWDAILANMTRHDPASLEALVKLRQQTSFKRLFKLASNMMVH